MDSGLVGGGGGGGGDPPILVPAATPTEGPQASGMPPVRNLEAEVQFDLDVLNGKSLSKVVEPNPSPDHAPENQPVGPSGWLPKRASAPALPESKPVEAKDSLKYIFSINLFLQHSS